ncbi:MAG TPA: DUF1223 domain-containing protein [Candidatus Acidoferrum sp.]|nr:DUF1223 domain-containing protein [Candidatus Acidoferrum sp.]
MENLKRLATRIMRFRFAIIVLVAFSTLAVDSLPYVHDACTSTLPDPDVGSRTPVLIELFTSEGCSSCPPADALLAKLDRSQPISGAELIVLSEHVDYWNDIGWKDPYSSHEYSERQTAYAARFGRGSVYTPQMVIDGHSELVGSDERRAIQAVQNETKFAKVALSLSAIRFERKNKLSMHIDAGPLGPATAAHSASLLLAIADDSDESQVSRGENAGRTLKHVAVLRSLAPVGTVGKSDKVSRDITVNFNYESGRPLRIVGIIQESSAGRVLGVASARFPN